VGTGWRDSGPALRKSNRNEKNRPRSIHVIHPSSIFDFQRDRERALRDALASFFQGRRNIPIPFGEVKAILNNAPEAYKGVHAVAVRRIVGSENRYRDFSRRFAPKSKRTRYRWMTIDTAYFNQKNLPPVVLYEAGSLYFVRDGNHRVSVAKSHGLEFIDAEVYSLNTLVHFEPDMQIADMLKVIQEHEHRAFALASGLESEPGEREIRFTEIAMYDTLTADIEKYRLHLEETARAAGQAEPAGFQSAAAAWYRDL
jgi:hypothetical protein